MSEPAETILLVEDEPAIRRLMSLSLTRAGYRVLEAPNGREAIRIFGAEGATIDVLLTDIRLPYIDGQELIERLRERRRTLKVLAFSASPLNAPPDGVPFLTKPFSREDLLGAVRDVLDG
jgi:CheY-like chemotaxis protein